MNKLESDVRGINAALNQVTVTLQAFATGIIDLQEVQRSNMISLNQLTGTVDTLAHTVDNISQKLDNLTDRVDNLSQAVEILVREEIPSLNAAVDRLDRIADYLVRRDGERNGN